MGLLTFNIDAFVNSPPSQIGDNTITISHNQTYTFTIANFTSQTNPSYSDPDGDAAEKVKITSTTAQLAALSGALEYNSIAVTQDQEISATGITSGLLKYIADVGTTTAYSEGFDFDISDVGSSTFSGLTGTMTMSVTAYVNQPPTTGDNTISSIAWGSTYTITTANLTTGTTPAYSDPEGDAAFLLRVNNLPASGQLLDNGKVLKAGDQVTFANITSGLFRYRTDLSIITAQSVFFDFDIQDTVSGKWSS